MKNICIIWTILYHLRLIYLLVDNREQLSDLQLIPTNHGVKTITSPSLIFVQLKTAPLEKPARIARATRHCFSRLHLADRVCSACPLSSPDGRQNHYIPKFNFCSSLRRLRSKICSYCSRNTTLFFSTPPCRPSLRYDTFWE